MSAAEDLTPPTSRSGRASVREPTPPVYVDSETTPDQLRAVTREPLSRGRLLFEHMNTVVRRLTAKQMPVEPRMVLTVMVDHANAEGIAWPAVETVANESGVSERTARSAIRDLEWYGWLTPIGDRKGGRNSTRYRVNLNGRTFDSEPRAAAPAPLAGAACPPGGRTVPPSGAGRARQGGGSCPPAGQGVPARAAAPAPDPLRDPLTETPMEAPNEAPVAGAPAGTSAREASPSPSPPPGTQLSLLGNASPKRQAVAVASPPPPPAAPKKPKAKAAPDGEHPLPDDFTPSDNHVARAKHEGVDLARVMTDMRLWAAEGNLSANWSLRLHTFLRFAGEGRRKRNEPEFVPPPPPRAPIEVVPRRPPPRMSDEERRERMLRAAGYGQDSATENPE